MRYCFTILLRPLLDIVQDLGSIILSIHIYIAKMPAADPTLNALFGPMSRKYCVWFYWLSVIGFVLLAYLVVLAVYKVATSGVKSVSFAQLLASIVIYGAFYFQNRLLHTMCSSGM